MMSSSFDDLDYARCPYAAASLLINAMFCYSGNRFDNAVIACVTDLYIELITIAHREMRSAEVLSFIVTGTPRGRDYRIRRQMWVNVTIVLVRWRH